MTENTQLQEDAASSILSASEVPLTPLAQSLMVLRDRSGNTGVSSPLIEARGARTFASYSDASAELSALARAAVVFDQGARVRLRITGEDRLRWLNGMVTNTVKTLAPGAHNYTFVLNAQGRIQGDATIFAFPDHLLLETDRSQAEHLFAHLDRFIIMDDVELSWADEQLPAPETTLGLAGPAAPAVLASAGFPVPEAGTFSQMGTTTVVAEYSPALPRYSVWIAEAAAEPLWQQLLASGARSAGADAVNSLRVLEATPLYGIDISNKTLAQETGQTRALNFNKGCYLGQEIVERIRSRATVHRGLRQFALVGESATAGTVLTVDGAAAGEITSVTTVALPHEIAGQIALGGQVALATVRTEALERGGQLHYPGGQAQALAASPLVSASNHRS